MRGCARRGSGFTLLEMLAVTLILGLLAALVLPRTGPAGARELREAARRIAADLELARQRTVMTGAPHRLWLELDGGRYRIEWRVSEARARASLGEPAPEPEPESPGSEAELDLSPPRAREVAFHPLASQHGRITRLPDEVSFAGVETGERRLRQGETTISFEADGTTERASIFLAHAKGGEIEIEVLPLADAVRVLDVR